MSSAGKAQIQLKVDGMCCADEVAQVEDALKKLDGVREVQASIVAGMVTIVYDPSVRDFAPPDTSSIRTAVEGVGCSIPLSVENPPAAGPSPRHRLEDFARQVLTLFGLVFAAVLFVVIVGEWLGRFEALTARVPWPLGLALVLMAGYPIFRTVIQAAFKGRITSHTLMTIGTLAALIVGEWAAAAVVVFFMRVGDYAERFTTTGARRAVKDLTVMAPQMARLERDGTEQEVPVAEVQVGETVIVRPGGKIPVDGEVVSGQATVDQATITGESMPVELGPGGHVFAATIARLGSLRIRATHVGLETTFGRVITLVEHAEAHRAEVLLIDKTGTLTFGRPQITDIVSLNGTSEEDVLVLAAAERDSEHPLAEAVREAARQRHVPLQEPQAFEAISGMGVRARVNGVTVTMGSWRMLPAAAAIAGAQDLEAMGKTLLFVAREEEVVEVLAAADTLRPEVPAAIVALHALGIPHIELLTGEHERTAAALAEPLGVRYRASLLPEEKIAIVKAYQGRGHTVIMVGDGVNDVPALAQADGGMAMGAAGTDVAMEAAHIALMRDDWTLVPEVLRIARRTMQVVKLNIAFTAVYNLAGLTLAALGVLPLIIAAAAQSLPDLGILANSSRLLRPGKPRVLPSMRKATRRHSVSLGAVGDGIPAKGDVCL